ncbi:pentapeptide repeat-containing protein [Streptosporangium sp. NPDC049248]|uniref:pentapeptide repeat-containing protein n=1 Tax=Streptosporangium sp. NPDC049248 TaxID=3155651 RepID=UPI0034342EF6
MEEPLYHGARPDPRLRPAPAGSPLRALPAVRLPGPRLRPARLWPVRLRTARLRRTRLRRTRLRRTRLRTVRLRSVRLRRTRLRPARLRTGLWPARLWPGLRRTPAPQHRGCQDPRDRRHGHQHRVHAELLRDPRRPGRRHPVECRPGEGGHRSPGRQEPAQVDLDQHRHQHRADHPGCGRLHHRRHQRRLRLNIPGDRRPRPVVAHGCRGPGRRGTARW